MAGEVLHVLEGAAETIGVSRQLRNARRPTGMAAAARKTAIIEDPLHGCSKRGRTHLTAVARRNRDPVSVGVDIKKIFERLTDSRVHRDRSPAAALGHVRSDPNHIEDLASRAEHRVNEQLCNLASSQCVEEAERKDEQVADRHPAHVRNGFEQILAVFRPQDDC